MTHPISVEAPPLDIPLSNPPTGAYGALKGLRVLDLSNMIAGPYCGRWLSDLGADVIKVESPSGDSMRGRPPLRDGRSAFFGHLNSGKRFIALDLKQPEAVAAARELACKADVLIEAFTPGVIDRLGLGANVLRALHPGLIYCSISGFGQQTTVAKRPAYAPTVHAGSGYDWALTGDAPQPYSSTVPLADVLTGMFALQAIQAALLQRQASGQGCHIDVNLMDSVMNVLPFEMQAAQFTQTQPRPTYRALEAQDGHILVTPINTKNFRNLCVAMGHAEWIDDPKFATDSERFAHWAEFIDRIEHWTRLRPAAESEQILSRHGVPCAVYRSVQEAMRDPQFAERQSFAQVADRAGGFLVSCLPYAFDGVRPRPGPVVGERGEHTQDVLSDWLGFSSAEIERLTASGAALCVGP